MNDKQKEILYPDQNGNITDWDKIEAIIFDVDGTLYFQKPVRIRMALKMMRHLLLHPDDFREMLGIFYFRKIREQESYRVLSIEEQAQAAAKQAGLKNEESLLKSVKKWMFSEPLPLIRKNADKDLISFLKRMKKTGKKIIIYSDYAPEDKLEIMQIEADAVYYPGKNDIREMKPSLQNMKTILSQEGIAPEKTVYFGDRMEKDGISAAMAGIRFIPVGKARTTKNAGLDA